MASIYQFIFPLILFFGISSEALNTEIHEQEITTYYLIRHAEKDRSNNAEKDPELTAQGLERAQSWANILKQVPLDMVISTNYKRTQQTGDPVASSKQLQIEEYDAGKGFSEDFQKKTMGKKVLVIGHSNTTPQLVNEMIGKDKYANIEDTENGALFIVQLLPNGLCVDQVLYIN